MSTTEPSAATLKDRIQDDIKAAMRAREKERLGVLRLIGAAIKQREVDERTTLDDDGVLAVLDKMAKQRNDSLAQYRNAGRDDLADQESYELELISTYLPSQLSPEEIERELDAAFTAIAPEGMRDMGKIMGALKPKLQGRADMGEISKQVRARLSG